MPPHSRRKGAAAEREVRDVLRRHGFEASRDAQVRWDGQPNEDLRHNVPGVHFEVKRRETLALPQWIRQCTDDARGREPVVVFRQSQQPWRVVCSLEHYLELQARLRALEAGG